MQTEIIKLIEAATAKTGWAESTLSLHFGNRFAAERVRKGTASLRTAERFKAWLQSQLDETPS
jgi:uncharacterized membrane protein YheB (UPF0754 family)